MTPTQNDQNIEGTPSLDLEAIKARAAAATEGPWEWDDSTIGQHWSRPQPWATVVDDIPALVAEVERLRTQLADINGDPAALEAVGLGYLARCGVDEGGKPYHGMRCDCWGPRDRP